MIILFSNILSFLSQGIAAAITWFDALMTGDLWTLVFSALAMGIVARFLIIPFFGGAGKRGSDKARKRTGNSDEG